MITLAKASEGKALKDFVRVPETIYANDPCHVTQLSFERLEHLSPKNPYFKHARHEFFVAYKDGKPIGRISAQIDELAQKKGEPRLGHFGFVDAADEGTLHALLEKAEQWLREHKVEKITGPYSISINDEAGLLVNGFESPARMMMPYGPQWLPSALENAGYKPVKDLLAYQVSTQAETPAAAKRIAAKVEEHPGVHFRTLNKTKMNEDLAIILDIFNKAWANNWGFVPMTADEMTYTAHNMKPLINPDLVQIAEINGEPAAMIVALPDLNEALSGLHGKLLPWGWARLIWRLKIKGPNAARVLLMGVLPEHRHGFLGGSLAIALMTRLHEALRKHGYKEAELSWVLDDNIPMIRLAESAGAKEYKRYRMYEKDLT